MTLHDQIQKLILDIDNSLFIYDDISTTAEEHKELIEKIGNDLKTSKECLTSSRDLLLHILKGIS